MCNKWEVWSRGYLTQMVRNYTKYLFKFENSIQQRLSMFDLS